MRPTFVVDCHAEGLRSTRPDTPIQAGGCGAASHRGGLSFAHPADYRCHGTCELAGAS